MSEYLEFTVQDSQRFAVLQQFFGKLKADKDAEAFDDDDAYLALCDEQARSYFGWYTEEEDAEWLARWYATPLETRWTDETLKRQWDFGSMIEAFKNGEYQLLSCELTAPMTARLTFESWAFPYGGTGCMQALIEAFGFKVVRIYDGASPPREVA
jgi:hypothetical protein